MLCKDIGVVITVGQDIVTETCFVSFIDRSFSVRENSHERFIVSSSFKTGTFQLNQATVLFISCLKTSFSWPYKEMSV